MKYFGMDPVTDDSHLDAGVSEQEWYSTYYLCGIEWANIISPLAAQHIPNLLEDASTVPNVCVKQMENGSFFLRSSKPIDQVDVSDLLPMKRLVYPALYPDGSIIPIRHLVLSEKTVFSDFFLGTCPRSNWAIIPMLENEIETVYTDLVFRHCLE
jgi:hypothetical protein